MTENEAIEVLKVLNKDYFQPDNPGEFDDVNQAIDYAIQSLAEIQKYREIGTAEQFRQLSEKFKSHTKDKTSCPNRGCKKCDNSRRLERMGNTEKVTEYVCDKLCKYAAEKGKPQKWLDKICERCEIGKLLAEITTI